VARGEEPGGSVEMLLDEGTDFETRHRRRTILTRMPRLGARIRRGHPVLVDQVLGTRDPDRVEAALRALPLEVESCFHFEVSVGAVFGLELPTCRRVALKVHQPTIERADLEAQHVVQVHLADRGFPCPRPVLGPTPFLASFATAEEWTTQGRRYANVTPARRRSMAAALLRIGELGRELGPLPELEAHQWPEGVWPEPHNALFDFEASRSGAEEIDEIARRAAERMHAGPIVLAHQDWSVKHFRFAANGRITTVYDWDSLSIDYESVALGGAAATHTAAIHSRVFRPSVEDALGFMADYEAERGGMDDALRRASLACAVYHVAYAARCEHALAASGRRRLVTEARAALPDFASELLA
jgi:hypothetical protein